MTSASAAILSEIQRAALVWQVRNFGTPEALVMLAGVTEEYGESCESVADTPLWLDSVGDAAIYLFQFCSVLGWNIGELWDLRDVVRRPDGRAWPQLMGKINHHYVKGRIQHYRGTQAEHDYRCRAAISALLRHWEAHLADMGRDFLSVVELTWAEVSQRDWAAEREAATSDWQTPPSAHIPVALAGLQTLDVPVDAPRVFEGVVKLYRGDDWGLRDGGCYTIDGDWLSEHDGKRVRLTVEPIGDCTELESNQ